MAKDLIIEVKNLEKRYRKAKELAVDGVSFYVERGSFFALLGPNGAGKTTIVSILTTLLSKTGGAALVDGYDVETEASEVRKRIGVIFQNPSLDLQLTAEENIRFHASLYGLYNYRPTYGLMAPAYQERVKQLSEVLGIEKDIFKPVKSFSGGMKRKLEIIRSLMHNPKVLFLDEPTTGLDPISRTNLWKYLKEMRQAEKTTIFLTTHYLEEAEDADYLCIINNGRIAAKGTPAEVKEELIDTYVMLDAKERDKLREELSSRGLAVRGTGPFKVETNGIRVAELIQQTKIPLSSVKIHNPTLEQAYVRIIERGE